MLEESGWYSFLLMCWNWCGGDFTSPSPIPPYPTKIVARNNKYNTSLWYGDGELMFFRKLSIEKKYLEKHYKHTPYENVSLRHACSWFLLSTRLSLPRLSYMEIKELLLTLGREGRVLDFLYSELNILQNLVQVYPPAGSLLWQEVERALFPAKGVSNPTGSPWLSLGIGCWVA